MTEARSDGAIKLLIVFSGENTPSWAKIRLFVGLNRLGVPGDRGRLFVRRGVVGMDVSGTSTNRSRGKSRNGPGRGAIVSCG